MRISVLVVCLATLTASAASADGPLTIFTWTPFVHGVGHSSLCINILSDASAGYDSGDRYKMDADPNIKTIGAYFRRDTGVDGWDGPSGWYFYQTIPDLTPGSSIVLEGLYVWASPEFLYDTFIIGYDGSSFPQPGKWVRTLRLVKIPDGINYTGPMEWTIPDVPSTDRLFQDAMLPAYKTDNPLTGYQFEVEIQYIPEPASILALAGGILGLGGLALRRKRA